MKSQFTSGKVPPEMLEKLVFPNCGARLPSVLVGPSLGVDGALVRPSTACITVSSDPITGSIQDIGRLVVHVNANDVAAMGGRPLWLVLTLILPIGSDEGQLEFIMKQVHQVCLELNISVIGGHTEISSAVNQIVAVGTMIGEVLKPISAAGAKPGDHLILSKSAAIEGTAILLNEKKDLLIEQKVFTKGEIESLLPLLQKKISVVKEANVAISIDGVCAMHDATEGGIANAIHEMADASKLGFTLRAQDIPILPQTLLLARHFSLDPLHLISSGSLLIAVRAEAAGALLGQLRGAGIEAADVGSFTADPSERLLLDAQGLPGPLPRPVQDALWEVLKK
eukprot:TRINITY_DN22583_c0_g1_i1.p1 TRINITY_DN22583_c0_g1~~TRINITY_DN22583_c0_g1_i1.p1  ORF type:complete len:339 (-),score=48.55 TRINITY_DN22583_c0_g1_i1:121-1137(-)